MKKIKSISFFNLWLKLVALCLIQNLNAQSVSPNIINQTGTPIIKSISWTPLKIESLEDWHYGGAEVSDGGFVFTTRIEQYDPSGAGNRQFPGLIKYDRNLKVTWHNYFKPGSFAKKAPFGSAIDSTQITGAEIHTKVIETSDGYLAFGVFYDHFKIFVHKVDKFGKTAPNFPRIFDYSSSDDYQINDITYVETDSFTGYIGVGHQRSHMAIFKIDSALQNLTTKLLISDTITKGEIFGMCLLFPNGSISRDIPKIKNEKPIGIAFNGWNDKELGYPNYSHNFNVYYGTTNFTLSNIHYFKLNHYANSNSLNTQIPQYSSLYAEPNPSTGLSYNFKGFDVCQTNTGDIGGLELWNYMFFSGDSAKTGSKCNGIKPTNADQIICGDIYVRQLKFDINTLALDTFVSGATQKIKHLGHSSGADYYPRIAVDKDDNFIILTNNTDSLNDVTNHYYLQKLNRNTDSIEWSTKKLGIGPSGICPFELLITENDHYITAGNNYDTRFGDDNEDLDIAMWSSSCQSNAILNATEFIPNTSNGHDFSVQQWSNVTPGNPTTIQIGGSGVVGSRIIVEQGYTLKILGGQGVVLQFPHVDEIGNNIRSSSYPLKNIVVEHGGKVIIENDVLLKGIENCNGSWDGIELLSSDPGQPQAELSMGSAEILGAITAIKVNRNGKILIGSTNGGEPQFINCANGIVMIDDDFSNSSKIIKANFDYQQTVEAGVNQSLNNHIYLENIHGLRIWGTQFINSDTQANASGKYLGTGIKAINSNFHVLQNQVNIDNSLECKPPMAAEPPCLFRKLSVGIDAVNLLPNYYLGYPIKVLNNRFENCRHAMHFGIGNSYIVYKNEIYIENSNKGFEPIYQTNQNFGITTNGVSQFQIIQNNIHIKDFERFTFGILINNSDNLNSADPSLVYGNKIESDTFIPNTNIALNVNESCSNLKINCNKDKKISTDWVFNPYVNISSIGSQNLSSGNEFTKENICNPNPTDNDDITFTSPFTYFGDLYCNDLQNIRNKPNFFNNNTYYKDANLNSCQDSNICSISKWNPELKTDFDGSKAILPPIAPPNEKVNFIKFSEELNRIKNNQPLTNSINLNTVKNSSSAISNKQNTLNQISIYPNPISIQSPLLNIKNMLNTNSQIEIYNLNSQKIKFDTLANNSIFIRNATQGIYFAHITTDNQSVCIKFVIID